MRLASMILAAVVAAPLVLAAPPAPPDVDELLLVGVKLHEAGAYDDAIRVFSRVLESDPSNANALYELAFSRFAKGEHLVVIELLARMVATPDKAPPGSWVLLGSAHAMLGHWAAAESVFRDGLAIRPDDPTLRFHLALSLSAQGRSDPAIDAFQSCLRSAPYRAEVWRAFGDALYDSGAKGRAFAAYARSLTLEEDSPASEEIAKRMWTMFFENLDDPRWTADSRPGEVIRARVPSETARSVPSAAEVAGMSMIAVLRRSGAWKEKSEATFFVYALDTTLKLVSSIQARESGAPFWGPFVLSYFDAMRDGGHMEALAYEIRRAAGDPEAKAWRERNPAKLAAYRRSSESWAVDPHASAPREFAR